MEFKWYVVEDGKFYWLMTPGGLRVAAMTRARAYGIAAALNTREGNEAFNKSRHM